MASEKPDQLENAAISEVAVQETAAEASIDVLQDRVWYKRLSEDWLATFLGLLLVLLIIVHLIHSVP